MPASDAWRTQQQLEFEREILSAQATQRMPGTQSPITRYYEGIRKASERLATSSFSYVPFEPAARVPAMTDDLAVFFDAARLELRASHEYKGRKLRLLNLMLDPATNTVKTFASLLIVARAVDHIRRTGENILIVTATSGNKGIALRCAVARALTLGLIAPDQLRIAVLLPEASLAKVRTSLLSENPELARLNPILVFAGTDSTALKSMVTRFQKTYLDEFARANTRIWQTLQLANYACADSVRAFFEYETMLANSDLGTSGIRLHVHAVSSAFGLLGYQLGRDTLTQAKLVAAGDNPGYFLVQPLSTPDMVLQLQTGSFDRSSVPVYTFDQSSGLYVQNLNPDFPQRTLDPAETLEPTFYTVAPATAAQMSSLIKQFGGGGIVVSLQECLERYAFTRLLLANAGIAIAADPRTVTEWATIMAVTGTLSAIDRGLIPERSELTIHASGYYTAMLDYLPLCPQYLPRVHVGTPMEELKHLISGMR